MVEVGDRRPRQMVSVQHGNLSRGTYWTYAVQNKPASTARRAVKEAGWIIDWGERDRIVVLRVISASVRWTNKAVGRSSAPGYISSSEDTPY